MLAKQQAWASPICHSAGLPGVERKRDATSVDLAPRMGSRVEIAKADLLSGAHAGEIRALLDQRGILLFRGIHPERRRTAHTLPARWATSARRKQARRSTARTLKEGEGGVMKVTLDPKVNPEYARFLLGQPSVAHGRHLRGSSALRDAVHARTDCRRRAATRVRQHLCRLRRPARRTRKRGWTICGWSTRCRRRCFPRCATARPRSSPCGPAIRSAPSAGLAPPVGPQVAGAEHFGRLGRRHAPGREP